MEDKDMKEYVYTAKQKLVKEDILKAQVLQKKSRSLHAHDADNFDWRYLCVAEMLK
jgi:hypothetical protein